MASENDPDSASLIAAFQRLGAPPEQARVMARQLLKRADQLAAERGLDRVQALDYLLKLTQSGRQGEVHPEANIHAPSRNPPK